MKMNLILNSITVLLLITTFVGFGSVAGYFTGRDIIGLISMLVATVAVSFVLYVRYSPKTFMLIRRATDASL